MKYLVEGYVLWDDSGAPVAGATVAIYEVGHPESLGESKTGKEGEFAVRLHDCDDKDCGLQIYVRVSDKEGKLMVSTHETPVLLETKKVTVNVTVPAALRVKGRVRPQIRVGPMLLNAEAVAKARPQVVLDLAKAMVDPRHEEKVQKSLIALSPDLVPSRHIRHTLCGTELLETIDALIKLKDWPREVALQVDDILRLRHLGFTTQIHDCPNFRVEYQDSGPAAVNPDTTGKNVLDPGTSNVIGVLPSGGPPTYIKLICFWLERALATYINPPF
ncbi:MAG TPA: carboxypeptidase-like regulatory domain-containing protein, partial [Saprospiraceae bacterium]|nr:carboxypeptidase-like regulatory domain-containing protein [Saprospiraceae bacterium]